MRKLNIFAILMVVVLAFSLVAATELGKNYETNCDKDGICTTKIYSFQKNYEENEKWRPIDENFGTENCEEGFDYCVDGNIYQFNAKNSLGLFETIFGGTMVSMGVNSISGVDLDSSSAVRMDGNRIEYTIIPDLYLRYTYLPNLLKEELIINDSSIFAGLRSDLKLIFDLSSPETSNEGDDEITVGDLAIRNLIAYDEAQDTIPLSFHLLPDDKLSILVPLEWLTSEDRVYPIYIDPTLGTDSSVNADYYVEHNWTDSTNLRIDSTTLDVGKRFSGSINRTKRSSIDFDISVIPSEAQIIELNFTMFHITVIPANPGENKNISVVQMEKNSSDYSNDASGNQAYFDDMENGTVYGTVYNFAPNFLDRDFYINLSNGALDDFENQLSAGKDTFSIGIHSINDEVITSGVQPFNFKSSTNSPASERPVLTITYFVEGANESQGDDAIEQGILNVLPGAQIHDEQQVYTRLANGTQMIGRFDKFVVYGNQRWGFNYVTSGESYVGMSNISDVFYTLEMEDMFAEDIEAVVEDFINGTVG